MKKLIMMMVLVLTIGAQAQDDGLDDIMASMMATKVHQDSIDTSSYAPPATSCTTR
jgi:hypothetical protein